MQVKSLIIASIISWGRDVEMSVRGSSPYGPQIQTPRSRLRTISMWRTRTSHPRMERLASTRPKAMAGISIRSRSTRTWRLLRQSFSWCCWPSCGSSRGGPSCRRWTSAERTVADQLEDASAIRKMHNVYSPSTKHVWPGQRPKSNSCLITHRDADIQKQQILESAQAAAAAEKDRAVREIHAAKNSALQELATKSIDTAVELAGQIVRRQLNPEDHSQLIGDALQQFSHDN